MPSPGRMRSMFTIFSNGSIIPPGFKFTELHALTLAARSYALLLGLLLGLFGAGNEANSLYSSSSCALVLFQGSPALEHDHAGRAWYLFLCEHDIILERA